MEKKRVLLGMSGGVDSSVSAIILQKQGYEVIGITLNLFGENEEQIKDAKAVCDTLNIQHHIFDCKKEFKEYVIKDFIECYSNCKTPNPCIECNKFIKFGVMAKKAKELNCNYIATGHYAKIEYNKEFKRYVLKKSNSKTKDQSYVLWQISKDLIENILFPLAEFENKEQIRQIAKENNLQIANKPDSEDICFIPNGDYKSFLENNSNLKQISGNIVNKKGEILGKHKGLYNYTIGQRRGLGIAYKVPLFVIGFNREKNEVIVGEEKEIYNNSMLVNNINLLAIDNLDKLKVKVKTRYSTKEEEAIIEKIDNDLIKVNFKNQVARITPGQSAVFYIEDIVIGGGKIVKILD